MSIKRKSTGGKKNRWKIRCGGAKMIEEYQLRQPNTEGGNTFKMGKGLARGKGIKEKDLGG